MIRRLALWALTLLIFGGLWAGPATAQSTFRIAVGVDPDTLDPVQMTTTTVANMVDYVVETLTFLDQEGKTRPMLAESWTVSPDGLQWTSSSARVSRSMTERRSTPRP